MSEKQRGRGKRGERVAERSTPYGFCFKQQCAVALTVLAVISDLHRLPAIRIIAFSFHFLQVRAEMSSATSTSTSLLIAIFIAIAIDITTVIPVSNSVSNSDFHALRLAVTLPSAKANKLIEVFRPDLT